MTTTTTRRATRITARQAKTQERYTFTLNDDHYAVLGLLARRGPMTDSELTFATRRHMIAPRRCELRDAGFVEQAGTAGRSMLWKLASKGHRFLVDGR